MESSSDCSDNSWSDYFDSDTSDSVDELLELETYQRPKNKNYILETVPQYGEEFIEHFRLSRTISENLAEKYENSQYFKYHIGPYGKLSAWDQTLIYLWYVGHQTASFRDVADRFDVTISSLFRIIRRLTTFISNLSPEMIKWSTLEEKEEIAEAFRIKGFPGAIGAIDGTHIKIDKPKFDPDSYINRKGYYSIQLQLICYHKMIIRDIFVGFPGSVHDSRVFRASPLGETLPDKCGEYFILGDSGYPLQANLMTPFKDFGNLTEEQINYNKKLSQNRYVIEHCFGLLKQKFRQLYHVKLRSIPDIVHLIRASCVLHNVAIYDDFPVNDEIVVAENENGVNNDVENENVRDVRNNVMHRLAQ